MLLLKAHRRSHVLVCLVLSSLSLLTGGSLAESAFADDGAQIRAHLAAGEFGPAREMAERFPDQQARDRWLSRIAGSQAQSGARRPSLRTAYDIQSDALRSSTFEQLATRAVGGPARGGAALADFDTLIELITSTVAPDSWDTIGGPGAISPFPTGVYVNTAGLMKQISGDGEVGRLATIRAKAALGAKGSRNLNAYSALRKVSLTRLERALQMRWALGKDADDTMRALAGIYDVQYLLFYPETRDIVLAGPASGWREGLEGRIVSEHSGQPVLLLDDLVVALRSAFSERGEFGCAITPVREGLAEVQSFLRDAASDPLRPSRRAAWLSDLRDRLGEQEISVFGIDPRTHAARVLVEADYHMKLVGMGLAEGTGDLKSYLETVTLTEDGTPPQMDVLRWWFTLNYKGIRATASHDAFEFVGSGVQVLSENELLDDRGGRIHTGESSHLNRRFAARFTENFDAMATKYPVYAELRNFFDLALAARIIEAEGLADQLDWQLRHFNDPERYSLALGPAPKRVESVINHRLLGRKHLIVGVSGGVRFDARALLQSGRLADSENGTLTAVRSNGDPSRVAPDIWWWD